MFRRSFWGDFIVLLFGWMFNMSGVLVFLGPPSKVNSNPLKSLTRCELKLVSEATTPRHLRKSGYNCCIPNISITSEPITEVRSVSLGLKGKQTELLRSNPKSHFQMIVNFPLCLEIEVLKSEARHRFQGAKTSWLSQSKCSLMK